MTLDEAIKMQNNDTIDKEQERYEQYMNDERP